MGVLCAKKYSMAIVREFCIVFGLLVISTKAVDSGMNADHQLYRHINCTVKQLLCVEVCILVHITVISPTPFDTITVPSSGISNSPAHHLTHRRWFVII